MAQIVLVSKTMVAIRDDALGPKNDVPKCSHVLMPLKRASWMVQKSLKSLI